MKQIHGFLLICILLLSATLTQAETRKEFIRKYKHIAIKEMERTGIPASIKLAPGHTGIRMRPIRTMCKRQ